jgi:hypothetical protein
MIKNTIAIAFIGTPHRGANLAGILNGWLKVTFSKTNFVTDLKPAGKSVTRINHTFGQRTKTLKLASFYESTGIEPVGVRSSKFS